MERSGFTSNSGSVMLVSTKVRETVRRTVPWWAKGALKLALVKAPIGYDALRWMALARHGGMLRPEFAFEAFHRHFDSADFPRKAGGFSMLELGPGDSLFCAL